MKRPFASAHVRAYSHATEDLDKVKRAVHNVVGDCELKVFPTEGHHGNRIDVIEAVLRDGGDIDALFTGLSDDILKTLDESLESRMDESCNLFLRLDKQAAHAGNQVLARTEDAIHIRLKVQTFPAKSEIAMAEARAFIRSELERRTRPP